MRYFVTMIMIRLSLCISACNGYSEISGEIFKRAECACKNNGGIEWIQVRAGDSFNVSRFNFHCTSGLETGWVLYSGNWSQTFHECPEDSGHTAVEK